MMLSSWIYCHMGFSHTTFTKYMILFFVFIITSNINVSAIHSTTPTATEQEERFEDLQIAVDYIWVLYSAVLVFFMQTGFGMLEAGRVQVKNTRNILLKNVVDSCVSAFAFYAIGYGIAFGKRNGNGIPFIGYYNFFLIDYDGKDPDVGYHYYSFLWAFSAAAATIVSGAVAERTKFTAYIIYSFFLTGWVFPVVAHWVWSEDGWLSSYSSSPLGGVGFIDFAGSAVVHMVGGISGLIGAYFVGPRIGRFDPITGKPRSIRGYSISVTSLGVYILWFGWFGFNGGSTLAISGGRSVVAGRVITNTVIAPCFAGVVCLAISGDLQHSLNGLLAGLVAVTGPCSVIEPYAAAITGCIAGFVYIGASRFVLHVLKIDDPLEASAVHGFCGMQGVIMPAFFAKPKFIEESFFLDDASDTAGIFYGGDGTLVGVQLLGLLSVMIWTAAMATALFWVMSIFGLMRLSRGAEETGMDVETYEGNQEAWVNMVIVRNGESTQHRVRLS